MTWSYEVQNSFLVNFQLSFANDVSGFQFFATLVQPIIEISEDLQKLLQKVYCHLFYRLQYIYIYYEIVHKVHNKKKMKKRQGKSKKIK